ncbi:MAG: DUF2847 family protein [Acidobacteria bacterium]|nr:DUF2847 family protein [Acidobacteriota bacterium]
MTATLNEIDSNEKLVELFERSDNSPVLLFKHSTTCPISSHVLSDVRELSAEINVIVVQHARGFRTRSRRVSEFGTNLRRRSSSRTAAPSTRRRIMTSRATRSPQFWRRGL